MKFSAKEAIRHAVLTLKNKSWPTYDGKYLDRTAFVSASESSVCIRQLAFRKTEERGKVEIPDFWNQLTDEEYTQHLNNMRDDDMRGIFERGNWMEEWIVQRLGEGLNDDEEIICTSRDQRSFYTKDKVSGTPDGIYVNHSTQTWKPLEFKSTQNPISAPKYAHVSQLQTNMGLLQKLAKDEMLDMPLDMPLSIYTMEDGLLLYVDSANYLTMTEFEVEQDGGLRYESAKKKATALFDGDNIRPPSELAPQGIEQNGCFFCPYKEQCKAIEEKKHNDMTVAKLNAAMERNRIKTPRVMPSFKSGVSKENAAKLLANFHQAKLDEAAAKKVQKSLREAIDQWIEEQKLEGKTEFLIDDFLFSVNASSVITKGRIDTDAIDAVLQEALGKTTDDFRKEPTTSKRLSVKVTPDPDMGKFDLDTLDDEEDDEDAA